MTDTLLTFYAIIGVCSFFYTFYDEGKRTGQRLMDSSNRERARRFSVALFLGAVGYPLAALVGCAALGVAGGLLYVSVLGIARVLGFA